MTFTIQSGAACYVALPFLKSNGESMIFKESANNKEVVRLPFVCQLLDRFKQHSLKRTMTIKETEKQILQERISNEPILQSPEPIYRLRQRAKSYDRIAEQTVFTLFHDKHDFAKFSEQRKGSPKSVRILKRFPTAVFEQ